MLQSKLPSSCTLVSALMEEVVAHASATVRFLSDSPKASLCRRLAAGTKVSALAVGAIALGPGKFRLGRQVWSKLMR